MAGKKLSTRESLKNNKCFILDNSLRESTVGQLRGHTLENKWKIYNEIKKVGIENIIVASFNHMTRVGDVFIEELKQKGEDFNMFWAFSELVESFDPDGRPNINEVPVGLRKCKQMGIKNVIIEFDLVYPSIDYNIFTTKFITDLMVERLKWAREHLAPDSKILFNFRDFPKAMAMKQKDALNIVKTIANLAKTTRPFGFIYEDPFGNWLPNEIGEFTAIVRNEMNNADWKEGHLLSHIHEQYSLADSTQLECLANGATGIWASLCKVGAFLGHASSSVTLMNLIRFGNKQVLNQYNCTYLRTAAQVVTEITTGIRPDNMQPVYGDRALDAVFGVDAIGDDKEFNMAKFFGVEPVMRITPLASAGMIIKRLTKLFGENSQFNESIALNMKKKMLEDLKNNRKEEYMSPVGLAMLFDRSGGKLTPEMCTVITQVEVTEAHHKILMKEVKEEWDEWDIRDGVQDDKVNYDAFYNGFMSAYFSCYRCEETTKALKALDMDANGQIDWNEFALYLKWALRQYPEIDTRDKLIDVAFRKGLIPAMQDEIIQSSAKYKAN